MQVTKGTWRMREQCVIRLFFLLPHTRAWKRGYSGVCFNWNAATQTVNISFHRSWIKTVLVTNLQYSSLYWLEGLVSVLWHSKAKSCVLIIFMYNVL